MRHFLELALAPAALACGMAQLAGAGLLVSPPSLPHRLAPSAGGARPRAVALAAITAPADVHYLIAAGAEKAPELRTDRRLLALEDWTIRSLQAILRVAVALVAMVVWREVRARLLHRGPDLPVFPSGPSFQHAATSLTKAGKPTSKLR
jgi:hypothetical protein